MRIVVVLALVVFLGCGSAPQQSAQPIPPPTLGTALNMPEVGASIQPPMNWSLDQLPGDPNATLRGPKEKGFPPLIICSMEPAPGDLAGYLKEHKARISAQDKTVKWISEQETTLDGRPAVRLEYETESDAAPPAIGKVRVHALQYIVEDKPTYYRVTCFVVASAFDKYQERFEASAKSFKRVSKQ
ncbi:MAG TPA: PsbP-related protein [Planctomycetota bacterium]|nr:PsbP-related protein [Planctomycetota bacterium]